MRVLVLGGSRFIGRAAVERLTATHDVTVLVRGESPPPDGVRVIFGDRTLPAVADAVVEPFDAIVDVSATAPEMIANMLPAFPWWGFTRYVFVGSGAVYDRTRSSLPFQESEPATGDSIWGPYGVAKAECEDVLRTNVDSDKLVILRPPYVYGPRNYEERERAIWARVLGGHPVFLPRDDGRLIQFCYVDSLAAVIDAAVNGSLASGIYNVGESRTYSLREFVETCCVVANRPGDLVPALDPDVPPRDYFPFRAADFYLDVARLAKTNLMEEVPLEAGLQSALAWFEANGGLGYEPTSTEQAWLAQLS